MVNEIENGLDLIKGGLSSIAETNFGITDFDNKFSKIQTSVMLKYKSMLEPIAICLDFLKIKLEISQSESLELNQKVFAWV